MTEIAMGNVNEIAEIISGFAFKSEWFGSGNDYVIRIGDLQNERINLNTAMKIDSRAIAISDVFRICSGDLLMALSGATTGKIAVATEKDHGAFVNQRVAIIRGHDPDNARYLKHLLSGRYLQKLLLSAGGAAQPNLSPRALANLEIPIPILKERRRIAAILDKADSLRRKRQQAIQLADDFLRATFLDMFGDPGTNPKKWQEGIIRDLVTTVNYGSSDKADETKGEYPILRMMNITYEGRWDFTSLKYIDLTDSDKEKYLARPGDLLFNRTNSKELVGKTAVFEEDRVMVFAGYLIRVRTNEKANPYFISAYLNSEHGKQTLLSMAKSIVGMANINAQELQNIKIQIPPIELQNKYAEIVAAVRKREKKMISSVGEINKLNLSLADSLLS